MCYPLPWFPLSDDPSRCIRHTTTDCLHHRSSHAGCRFGSSGSSGFVGVFRLLRWSSYVPVQGFVCTSHALRQDWKFHAGYGLLILVRFLIFCYIRNSDIFIIKHIVPNLLIKFFCGHLLRYFKGCVSTRKLIM